MKKHVAVVSTPDGRTARLTQNLNEFTYLAVRRKAVWRKVADDEYVNQSKTEQKRVQATVAQRATTSVETIKQISTTTTEQLTLQLGGKVGGSIGSDAIGKIGAEVQTNIESAFGLEESVVRATKENVATELAKSNQATLVIEPCQRLRRWVYQMEIHIYLDTEILYEPPATIFDDGQRIAAEPNDFVSKWQPGGGTLLGIVQTSRTKERIATGSLDDDLTSLPDFSEGK